MSREDSAGSAKIAPGDDIEIIGIHGVTWEVQEVKACHHHPPTAFPHSKYRIPAPEGESDWWCANKVRKVNQ